MPKTAVLLQGKIVLQVIPRMISGGAEQGTLNIAQALINAGAKALIVSAGGSLVSRLEAIGANHITLPVDTKNPLIIIRNAFRLRKIIVDRSVDLIHARSRAPAWSSLWAARLTKCPFVTTFHAAYPYKTPLKRYYNSVMARGQRVIAISTYIQHFIFTHYRQYLRTKESVCYIPRGVDCELFTPKRISAKAIETLRHQWNVPEDRLVIMLPARITRIKGHTTLVKALTMLPHEKFVCVMVGGSQGHAGYRQELDDLIQKHNLSSSVIFAGETQQMPTAFALADIVVSPSLAPEGFGRVFVEAQAMGKPVIAADHGPVREIIEHGRTGWLFKPGDAQALAQLISDVAALSSQEKKRLAVQARQNASERFSLEHMCSKTLDIYEELIRDAQAA